MIIYAISKKAFLEALIGISIGCGIFLLILNFVTKNNIEERNNPKLKKEELVIYTSAATNTKPDLKVFLWRKDDNSMYGIEILYGLGNTFIDLSTVTPYVLTNFLPSYFDFEATEKCDLDGRNCKEITHD